MKEENTSMYVFYSFFPSLFLSINCRTLYCFNPCDETVIPFPLYGSGHVKRLQKLWSYVIPGYKVIYWIFLDKTNHQGKRGETAKQTTSPNFWPLCSRTDHCFLPSSQSRKWLPLVFDQWLPRLQQTTHNLANFSGESPSLYTCRV